MAIEAELSRCLREAAGVDAEWADDVTLALEARLREAEQVARQAFPGVEVSPRDWLGHVAAKAESLDEPLTRLQGLHLDELYLVAGCLVGDRAALAAFDQRYMAGVSAVVGKLAVGPDASDEVTQELRASLLVARGDAAPKLSGYSGRGALAGWLKVIATRTALRRKRRRRPDDHRVDSVLLERLGDGPADPELEHVKLRYQADFAAALEHAFRQLRTEQKNLLRMYVTDGLTLGELGSLHDVNASTVSRWLARIRESLLETARAELTARLDLRPSEYESLNKALQSGLHVSVERLLAAVEPPEIP